jgi:hypothetical protein
MGLAGSAWGQFGSEPIPATTPSAALPQTTGVQLRALQAVLDSRERQQDWHVAAQQAVAMLENDALKAQLTQRLSGLAPRIAKALVAQPQDDALVDIDVYREAGGEGKEAMVSVTFQGMEEQIGGDYYGSVLAGEPAAPQAQDVPQGLVYDPRASSSIVFFMGTKGLQAGNIPHDKMKQSILAAINHQHDLTLHEEQLAYEQEQARQEAAAREQQAAAAAGLESSGPAQQQVIPDYPNTDTGYDDGYYYPGIGVPIVIVPNGIENTPEARQRERRREEALERQTNEQRRARHAEQPAANDSSPFSAGVAIPPGSQGIVNRQGGGGVFEPAGQAGTVNPPGQAGMRTGAGQGNTQRQAPAPPPARQAPPAQGAARGGGRK